MTSLKSGQQTKPKDIILDSFLGSGSTLIAGEALGRRVYGCELEPLYCDLIVRRYEKLTRKKAIYEKT
jgi:DNA modification methylase